MKRIRLLVLLGAVAVALPLGLTTARATGTTGTARTLSPGRPIRGGWGTGIGAGWRLRRISWRLCSGWRSTRVGR